MIFLFALVSLCQTEMTYGGDIRRYTLAITQYSLGVQTSPTTYTVIREKHKSHKSVFCTENAKHK